MRQAFDAAETGFDPVRISDGNSATITEAIFERLLTYDYLARPAKLVPMVTTAMPEVSADGRTYTFRLRPGILFAPDPAFKGAPRELVAQDFVYTFMRFLDPANHAPYAFMIEGRIKGLDALAAAAAKTGRFDYDAKLPDLEAVDRYTLRVQLAQADNTFPYVVAHTSFGAVAREVIEAYAGRDRGASRRHRRVPARRVDARVAHRADRQSGLSRLHVGLRGQSGRRARRGAGRRDEGQAHAAGRPRRDLDRRGVPVAVARVPAEAAATS